MLEVIALMLKCIEGIYHEVQSNSLKIKHKEMIWNIDTDNESDLIFRLHDTRNKSSLNSSIVL